MPTRPDVDTRIRYYSNKISSDPRLYPVYAQLAVAYLDKARETHDPSWLAKARSSLSHSIEIQPNFLAFKMMAALSNFSHHFEDALRWGKRAALVLPTDISVTALRVEAYMGLGRYDEAVKLLPPRDMKPTDFYTAAARGHWLSSQYRYDEAREAFLEAAEFAQAASVTDLVVWAKVSAAGTHLDSGRPGLSRAYLDAAAKLTPGNKELRLHRAELFVAEDRLEEALAVYETLLEKDPDPEVCRQAFVIARRLGQEKKARLHFEAAEKGFQRAIEAGEIYTLGALARLYCDAEVNLERALALAQRNLEYKRDIQARATLRSVDRKLLRSR